MGLEAVPGKCLTSCYTGSEQSHFDEYDAVGMGKTEGVGRHV